MPIHLPPTLATASLIGLLITCTPALSAPPAEQPAEKPPEAAVENAEPPAADGEASPEESPSKAHDGAEKAAAPPPCAGGVIKDDGTVDTGYGFVPSLQDGVYVQEYHTDEFPSRKLEKVCVALLRSRGERQTAFEVVFYRDSEGLPEREPFAAVPAEATVVPNKVAVAGDFYEVDVSGITLPPGRVYIGVRWSPSQASFLFICADTGESTSKVPGYFHDDRSRGWTDIFLSKDPIFEPHRSLMLRVVAARKAEAEGEAEGEGAAEAEGES